jgi:hypothetical protein
MHGALCAKAYVEGAAMSCYKCGVPPCEVMGDNDWQTNQDKAEVYLGGAEIVYIHNLGKSCCILLLPFLGKFLVHFTPASCESQFR